MKNKILYLCNNNGTDTRISKELLTLAKVFDVYFIGVSDGSFSYEAKKICKEFFIIKGSRRSILVLLKYFIKFFSLKLSHQFQSFHVVNEAIFLWLYPWLIFEDSVVLDVFDSFFLRKKIYHFFLKPLVEIVYMPSSMVIVTDENRKALLRHNYSGPVSVLENFPYLFINKAEKKVTFGKRNSLTIYYNGSMGLARGTRLIQGLLSLGKNIKVFMAGWIYDEETRILSKHPCVEYLGVIDQKTSMNFACHSDYILCVYEPSNQNNINASPNKIYDAIQVKTPVIINSEVRISSFVERENLGVVISKFDTEQFGALFNTLLEKKDSFCFSKDFSSKFTWQAVEYKLLSFHDSFYHDI